MKVCLCGVGAIGGWLALFVARPDIEFLIIDDDRVAEENLGTSVYYRHHCGAFKAVVLAEMLYRKCGAIAKPYTRTLDKSNVAILLRESPDLIVDSFDNSAARACASGWWNRDIGVLHIGVSETRQGSAVWDETYKVPDGPPRGEDEFCTRDAGRKILRFTAAVAAGIVDEFLKTGNKRNAVVSENMEIFYGL